MSRHSVSVYARLRYAFENTLSKGPIAMIGWLALLSLAIILVGTGLMQLLDLGYSDNDSFTENFWNTLMRPLMPATWRVMVQGKKTPPRTGSSGPLHSQ